MTKKLTYNATITERRDITETLATFRIVPDEGLKDGDGRRPFLPGQYVTVGLPAHPSPDSPWVQRPFSIASAPEDRGGIELYVRRVERPESEAPLSHRLFDRRPSDR